MKRPIALLCGLSLLAVVPADEPVVPYSAVPAWSISSSPAFQEKNEGSYFTQVGNIADQDTYAKLIGGGQVVLPNNSLGMTIDADSGSVAGAVNIAYGSGSRTYTWTIKAMQVGSDTLRIDEFTYIDGSPEICIDAENAKTYNNVLVKNVP